MNEQTITESGQYLTFDLGDEIFALEIGKVREVDARGAVIEEDFEFQVTWPDGAEDVVEAAVTTEIPVSYSSSG